MTSPHEPDRAGADDAPARVPGSPAAAPVPIEPEQSAEDTDAAWGEYPDQSDDRLLRDRPPHWSDY